MNITREIDLVVKEADNFLFENVKRTNELTGNNLAITLGLKVLFLIAQIQLTMLRLERSKLND